MSDSTTTWLKKNPSINPMSRSLKASLRFHAPNLDMDASIISNPDNVKSQEMFVPRMLQRQKMQMRMSRAHQFKVPELLVTKSVKKKENMPASSVKSKKSPAPRKSFLPVPKKRTDSSNRNPQRPSLFPGGSSKRTLANREIIKQMVELSEVKKKLEGVSNELNVTSANNSVLRSILKKKRASLQKSSQISATKPKAKKVLFDGFENSYVEEKENVNLSLVEIQFHKEDDSEEVDEPTVFLNFSKSQNIDTSQEVGNESEKSNWTVTESDDCSRFLEVKDISTVLKLWDFYKESLNDLENIKISVESSVDSLLEHVLTFQNKYITFKQDSEQMYKKLSSLGEELEKNLKKVLEGNNLETPKRDQRPGGKKLPEENKKLKISDKSRAIKKSSGKKVVPVLTKDLLRNMNDSLSLVHKKCGFL